MTGIFHQRKDTTPPDVMSGEDWSVGRPVFVGTSHCAIVLIDTAKRNKKIYFVLFIKYPWFCLLESVFNYKYSFNFLF